MKKIDAIIGNPPYKGDIHLEILEQCYQISNITSLVQPGKWVYIQKPGNTLKKSQHLKNIIGKDISYVELLNGSNVFNIELISPCSITLIDKNNNTDHIHVVDKANDKDYHLKDFKDINPFLSDDVSTYNNIKNKIWQAANNYSLLDAINNRNDNDNFFIYIPRISGHVILNDKKFYCDDYYQLVYEKFRNIQTKPNDDVFISFNDEYKAIQALKYLVSSNVAKFALKIVKTNLHLMRGELKYVPMFDFDFKYSESIIYEKLKLSSAEIQFIDDNVDYGEESLDKFFE